MKQENRVKRTKHKRGWKDERTNERAVGKGGREEKVIKNELKKKQRKYR
jgi:hypothetical protein